MDGRADIYALGCVLYEMLAGEPPYTGPTAQAIIAKRMLEPIPRVRTVRESVPQELEGAITRALAKTPVDRYATAGEFADALARAASRQAVAPETRRTVGRSMALLGLFAAVAVTLWWIAGGADRLDDPARPPRAAGSRRPKTTIPHP